MVVVAGGGSHSVSFELMSPCWAGFDIQTMRQGSTQGGRLPCNINSHLESSCGCGHETLKETAAMDPVPSQQHSRCLLQLPPHCSLNACLETAPPPLIPPLVSPSEMWPTSGPGKVLSGAVLRQRLAALCVETQDKEMNCDGCRVQVSLHRLK